jgi:hypothetical protein
LFAENDHTRVSMKTAAEYRVMAEKYFKWARGTRAWANQFWLLSLMLRKREPGHVATCKK